MQARIIRSWRTLRVSMFAAVLGFACRSPAPPPEPLLPGPDQALRAASARGEVPSGSPIVSTKLQARLDGERHQVDGVLHLHWRNTSTVPLDHLTFHLYMNGFRSPDSAWMKTARGTHRGQEQGTNQPWGWIDVSDVKRHLDGHQVALEMNERDDPSLGDVPLQQPLAPGETIDLTLTFQTQLPEVFARTGFSEDFHLVGQWFPKIAVIDKNGAWSDFVFTLNSEFYADFGDYDVDLDVPAGMTVGATGILVSKTQQDERQQLRYHAEWVHDFAWTAWPDFVEYTQEIEGVWVRLLLPPDQAWTASTHFQALGVALRSMEARFGPYPWSTLTLVVPPEGAGGAGGMEYPTFITSDPIEPIPQWASLLGIRSATNGRFVTVHEFGHQYFQGLLASNEDQAPWLDEGLNTFANFLTLSEDTEGPSSLIDIGNQQLSIADAIALGVSNHLGIRPIASPAAAFDGAVQAYGPIVYGRTAALMFTLRNVVGHEAFDNALQTYALTYRFEHPTTEDFEQTMVRELAKRTDIDVAAILQQGLHDVRRIDFGVRAIRSRTFKSDGGFERDSDGSLIEQPSEDFLDEEHVVVIERIGDFAIPVDVLVTFESGQTEHVQWDGQTSIHVWTWSEPIARVDIDPEFKLVLEADRKNNHRQRSRTYDDPFSVWHGRLADFATLWLSVMVGP